MEFMAKVSIVVNKRTKAKRQASVSVIGSYRSAIAMLYEESNIKFNDETVLALNKFAGGYKRLVADEKHYDPHSCTAVQVPAYVRFG